MPTKCKIFTVSHGDATQAKCKGEHLISQCLEQQVNEWMSERNGLTIYKMQLNIDNVGSKTITLVLLYDTY
ncbi:MAG: hypothetical protein P1P90_01210 [Patescibacteria group bacterium]|nr:hypothetical protein [Patescibacteria group bacterium]